MINNDAHIMIHIKGLRTSIWMTLKCVKGVQVKSFNCY